ncbi:hypothetical protein D9C73_028355 [Collichthys lucidus]|uniref:Uncharacterized protein n=1 Tax=Collichthys lucidus TaxID=240159 RepID=A0A4U5TW71_COLLU|nr:hypothetical protein D9C73_028355 [Collichthys lucidus]
METCSKPESSQPKSEKAQDEPDTSQKTSWTLTPEKFIMNHFRRQSDRCDEDTCMRLKCETLPALSLKVVIDSETYGASVTPSGLLDLRLAVASIYSNAPCYHEYFTRLRSVHMLIERLMSDLCSKSEEAKAIFSMTVDSTLIPKTHVSIYYQNECLKRRLEQIDYEPVWARMKDVVYYVILLMLAKIFIRCSKD